MRQGDPHDRSHLDVDYDSFMYSFTRVLYTTTCEIEYRTFDLLVESIYLNQLSFRPSIKPI